MWLERAEHQLQALSPESLPEFERQRAVVLSPLNLAGSRPGPGSHQAHEAARYVLDAFDQQVATLSSVIGDGSPGEDGLLWIVADTNALLKAPALSDWSAGGACVLILIPQVLRELDQHKQHHRVESVRDKAQKLHRQFNELERRGDTTAGVKVADKLLFREIPIDAPVSESLTWLRSNHPDDQLLASVLDLSCRNPDTAITLVSEDRALLNKARQAGVTTDRAPLDTPGREAKPSPQRKTRPMVRVKNVTIEHKLSDVSSLDSAWPQEPRSILVVELVNAGPTSAFDIAGAVFFVHRSGSEEPIGRAEGPVLEPGGTYRLRLPRRHPGWPTPVGPTSARMKGSAGTATAASSA
jgi:PIN domain